MADNPITGDDSLNTPEPEFDELSQLSPETLQASLQAYHKALEEEFEVKASNSDPKKHDEITKDYFRKNRAFAAEQIVWLSKHSTSDSVRMAACKYIDQRASDEDVQSGDPIKELLIELGANDKTLKTTKTKK